MSMPKEALVIGGGIAGPVTALALAKAGIEATVFEGREGATKASAMLSLAPNGLDALQVIGADRAVEAVGQPVPGVVMADGSGNELGEFPGFPGLPPTLAMSRADLVGALADHAAAQGIPIQYGKRLVGAEAGSNGVQVSFADGTRATGDLMIGADGIHSTVRGIIDPHAPDPEYQGILGFGGFAPGTAAPAESGKMYFAFGRTFIGYWRLPDTRICWFASLPRTDPLTAAEVAGTPPAEWLMELRAVYAGHVPGEALLTQADPASLMAVGPMERMPPVPHWYRGSMVLAGDSVHAPSSSSGQGASLAIESAVQLARCLRDQPTPTAAFAAYEHLRRARVEMIGGAATETNRAKAGQTETVSGVPSPEQMFAPVHRHHIEWREPVTPSHVSLGVPLPEAKR
jgi:2-polyprenyl-6-methoxyphenol hydroxylase-like FAD-dependent oxidoreductase